MAAGWAEHGLRVLLVARREELDGDEDPERELEPLGLIGLADTPRASARASVAEAREAGVRTIMITGDHPADRGQRRRRDRRRRGGGPARGGHRRRARRALGPDALRDAVRRVDVFARVVPEHKVRIVEALKRDGQIAAMTGDGVNDVPALKAAHIGVAMGRRGTDAASEAADMVLTDDDYSTIVRAIRQGRAIHENIVRFAHFLFAGNAGEVLAFALAVVLGLGAPLTVLQILLVNLLLDGLPAAALGVDPPEKTVMARPPRAPDEGLLDRVWVRLLVGGAAIGAAIFASFLIGAETSHVAGQTMAFTTLVFGRLLFVFTVRGEGPFWRAGRNPRLFGAVALSAAVALVVLLVPALASASAPSGLDGGQWLAALALARRAVRRAGAVEARSPGARRAPRPARPRGRSRVMSVAPSIPPSRPTCSCATCTRTSTASPSARPTGASSATAATSWCAAAGAAGRAQLAQQFTHPLALLLTAAARSRSSAGIAVLAAAIAAVIVLNAALAFVQERQAEAAVEALKDYLPPHATVIRDGREQQIEAALLVPGDMVVLARATASPPTRGCSAGALELDMSALTGESLPVAAQRRRRRHGVPLLMAPDLVFTGTSCTGGEALGVVFATGMQSQLGRVAALSEPSATRRARCSGRSAQVAWLIALVAVVAGVAFVPLGTLVAGLPLGDAVIFAIGLLVANVPEGLLPTITLALAVGVRRLARRGALVKRLSAVETLGSTTVICTDKTGTLTENRMRPVSAWTMAATADFEQGDPSEVAEPLRQLAAAAAACNTAHLAGDGGDEAAGDPTEVALLDAARRLGADAGHALRGTRRRRMFHFDPRLKLMSTVDDADGGWWVDAKGAPDVLLERCATVLGPDGEARRSTPAIARRAARRGRALGAARAARAGRRAAARRRRASRARRARGRRARAVLRRPDRPARPAPRRTSPRPSRAATPPASGSSSSPATTGSPPPRSRAASASARAAAHRHRRRARRDARGRARRAARGRGRPDLRPHLAGGEAADRRRAARRSATSWP